MLSSAIWLSAVPRAVTVGSFIGASWPGLAAAPRSPAAPPSRAVRLRPQAAADAALPDRNAPMYTFRRDHNGRLVRVRHTDGNRRACAADRGIPAAAESA